MTPEAQAARNFTAWWGLHGITPGEWVSLSPSRIYYRRTEYLDVCIAGLVREGVLLPADASNHGVDVLAGYREDVAGCSAQIVVRWGLIEMDFDLHNPTRDLVSAVGHLGELLSNKLGGHGTDPLVVAEQLRQRGLDV